MKKLFSTLALVMCLVSMSFAQMVDPIRWTSEMKQDGKNVEISDRIPDHPVCVDKKYYFAAVVKKPKEKTKKSEG